jgi:hypothetical protein
MKHLYASLCAALLLPLATPAQTPGGTVTGLVLAQDTQRPVRFAEVQFDPVKPTEGRNRGGGLERVRTEVDGTFTAPSVPAGDYYVTASAVGYIPERELLLAKINAGADPAQLLSSLPMVHVAAGGNTNVTVTLERGATISGRLQWEDGSPVAGQAVTANHINQKTSQLPAPLPQLPQFGNNAFAVTDDRGAFRISGLAAGDYVVLASVHSSGPRFGGFGGHFAAQPEASVTFYAPGVFHASAAQVFTLRAGDERTDVRLTLDMRSLRTVSGTATSSNGSPVASGAITLMDPNDPAVRFHGSLAPDGSFTLRYVPQGTYMLQLFGASSQPASGRRETSSGATTFQPLSQTVTVTDSGLSNLTLTLTPNVNTH